jgi:hypothetical protein
MGMKNETKTTPARRTFRICNVLGDFLADVEAKDQAAAVRAFRTDVRDRTGKPGKMKVEPIGEEYGHENAFVCRFRRGGEKFEPIYFVRPLN